MNNKEHDHTSAKAKRPSGGTKFRLQVASLPWRITAEGQIEVMLITSRDTGRWVLPKGWIEAGEEHWEAAAREAREEAGIEGTVSGEAAGRYRYIKTKASGRDIPCEVMVFPLEVGKVAGEWKEKGQRRRRWVAPEDAVTMVQEADLGELLLAFSKDHTEPRQQTARIVKN